MGCLLPRDLVLQLFDLGIMGNLLLLDLGPQLFDFICDLGGLAINLVGVFTSAVMVTLLASRYDCIAPGALSLDSRADSQEVGLHLPVKDR